MLTHNFISTSYPTIQEVNKELQMNKGHKAKHIHSISSIHDEKKDSWRIIVIYHL